MKDRSPSRRFGIIAALIVIGFVTPASLAQIQNQYGVINRGVQKRMATMGVAKTSIETLVDMMAGRMRFDRKIARTARRELINATRAIPKEFKKPHLDRLSRARVDIWLNWDDFEIRADTANRAARQLNINRLEGLRTTLPDMIRACLSCHQTYRKSR